VKAVSGAISDWAASKFSLTVYDSIGALGLRIRSLHVKRVLRATSDRAATRFSKTVYESPGAVWAAESIRHL
jgi:hypothetical protein